MASAKETEGGRDREGGGRAGVRGRWGEREGDIDSSRDRGRMIVGRGREGERERESEGGGGWDEETEGELDKGRGRRTMQKAANISSVKGSIFFNFSVSFASACGRLKPKKRKSVGQGNVMPGSALRRSV